MFKKIKTYMNGVQHIWKFWLPVHLALLVLPVSWWQTLLLWLFVAIGTEVGTHRYFAHKAFTTHPWIEKILLLGGTLAAQGTVLFWAGAHRGLHHPFADTEKDPHSPIAHGWWHGYMGWLVKSDSRFSFRSVPDLMRNKDLMFLHNHFYKVLAGGYIAAWVVGGPVTVGSLLLAQVLCLHQNLLVNVLCHIKIGYRRYDTNDQSVNLAWLSVPTIGLSLHNNHHGKPALSNFSTVWYEFDPGYWVIRLIGQPRYD